MQPLEGDVVKTGEHDSGIFSAHLLLGGERGYTPQSILSIPVPTLQHSRSD